MKTLFRTGLPVLLWLVLSPLLLLGQATISPTGRSLVVAPTGNRVQITFPDVTGTRSGVEYRITQFSPNNTVGRLYVGANNTTTALGAVSASGTATTITGGATPQLYFVASGLGTITFDFLVRDANNGGNQEKFSSVATFTIKVSSPPTANNVRAADMPSNADATAISALSATATSGTSISTYTLKTLPTGGKLYLNSTEITALRSLTATEVSQLNFDPSGAQFGDLSFTYTATSNDGLESSNTATYTIPVANVPPAAVNDPIVTVTRNQSASVSVLVNDTDTDKDATGLGGIVASTVDLDPDAAGIQQTRTLANKGTFTVNAQGIVTFVPVNNYAGISTITYTVQDAQGLTSNQASIRVEVKNVTTAYDDSNEVEKNTTVSGNVILNDIDPNNTGFTVSLVAGKNVTHGTLTLNANGSYTYKPTTDYIGTDSFTYQACDKATPVQCSTATVYLNVYDPAVQCIAATGPNQLVNPSFTDGNVGFNTNYEYKANVAGNQELVPETTYAIGSDANEYHPNFFGNGHGVNGASVVGNNFMMVNATSAIRTLYTQTFKVQPNRYYTFSAYFNNLLRSGGTDPEVGFVINGQSTSGTITVRTTPDEWVLYSDVWYSGDNTTATFEIRNLTLDAGGNDIGIDDLYFGTCNAVPVANNTVTAAIASNTTTATAIKAMDATDPDGTIASFTIKSLPTAGTLYVNGVAAIVDKIYTPTENTKLTYVPTASRNGNFTFTFLATDNTGSLSNIATYTIPVGNTAPLAENVTTAPAISNTAGATAINPLKATDGDGTIVKYFISSVPNTLHGTLYVNGVRVTTTPQEVLPSQLTQLSFDPTGTYAGNATFTYYALDNDNNQSNTAIYTIPISNELPVAQNKTATGIRNTNSSTPLSALVATDADGTIASYTVATLPSSGSLTLNGVSVAANQTIRPDQASELSYAPAKTTTGNFNFTYYATDNLGGISNVATYTLPIGGPLPVELVGFEVRAVGNSAQLTWNTASELHNDRFEVERSSTGEGFSAIGTVKGKGNTNTGVTYRFTDANVRNRVSGTVYYRLKQVDTNGEAAYSSVRTVAFSKQEAAISVAPNPATSEAALDLTALPVGQYQVSVFDATGRTTYSAHHTGGQSVALPLGTWPSGMYLVVVRGEAGKFSQRVVKQ